jgi:hypothetical protein
MNRRSMVSRQHYQKAYFTLWRKHSCLIFIYHSLNNLHNFTACNYLVSDFENIANSTTKKCILRYHWWFYYFFFTVSSPSKKKVVQKDKKHKHNLCGKNKSMIYTRNIPEFVSENNWWLERLQFPSLTLHSSLFPPIYQFFAYLYIISIVEGILISPTNNVDIFL